MKRRKPAADQRQDRQHPRLQGGGQVGAEAGHRAAAQRQDQHPEDHRALMVPPGAADLVEQGFAEWLFCDHVRTGCRSPQRPRSGSRSRGQPRRAAGGERGAWRPSAALRRCAPTSGRAPPGASDSASASASAKWPSSGIMTRSVSALAWLVSAFQVAAGGAAPRRVPVAAPLQRVGDFLRHVGLVVLGQHLAARGTTRPARELRGDDPWPSRNRSGSMPNRSPRRCRAPSVTAEPHGRACRRRRRVHAAAHDQPAQADGAAGRGRLGRNVGGRDEEHQVVAGTRSGSGRWRCRGRAPQSSSSQSRRRSRSWRRPARRRRGSIAASRRRARPAAHRDRRRDAGQARAGSARPSA